MVAEREKIYKKLIYCIFLNNKKCFPLLTCKDFSTQSRRMRSIASGLKFCGARTPVDCAILAHAASRVTFHGYFVYLNQTIQDKLFQELRIHLSADSYLWSLHLVVNIVKPMFKSTFLSLIFTPCRKYTYSKNNVKFLKSTS